MQAIFSEVRLDLAIISGANKAPLLGIFLCGKMRFTGIVGSLNSGITLIVSPDLISALMVVSLIKPIPVP